MRLIQNYFITATRHFFRHPIFSGIKVFSLTIGLSCAILVAMHVHYVESSNKHIDNWENTYRIVSHLKIRESNTPYRTRGSAEAYSGQLQLDYPGLFTHIAKIRPSSGLFRFNQQVLEEQFFFAEPDAVSLFDLEFLQGDPDSALTEPYSMVVTESVAERLFGTRDALNLTITYNNNSDLQVTGVIKDYPRNATHHMDIIISVATGRALFGENFMAENEWLVYRGSQTYISFPNSQSAAQLNREFANFVDQNLPDSSRPLAESIDFGLSLQRIDDIYLNPLNNFNAPENSTARYILLGLLVFAALITLGSCINYTNLSLAQFALRTKEIGVRKVLGADKTQIVWQFLLDSLFLTLVALVIALPLVYVLTPAYNALAATSISFTDLLSSNLVVGLIALVIATSFIAGIIPALSISKLGVIAIIKGSTKRSRSGSMIRNSVTVAQFTISTVLIMLAIAIYLQTEHLRNLDAGFDKANLVVLDTRYNFRDPEAFDFSAMRNEIERIPGVLSTAGSVFSPPRTGLSAQWHILGSDPNQTMSVVMGDVGVGFIETLGLQVVAGRSFSDNFPADVTPFGDGDPEQNYGIVITDLLASRLGLGSPDDALGTILVSSEQPYRIVGVVRNFQFSPGMENDELSIGIFRLREGPLRTMYIRAVPFQLQSTLERIDATWETHRNGIPLDRVILEQVMDDMIEERNSGLSFAASLASVVTITIAIFGLYAVASYSLTVRTKEIGIRKVLGASGLGITKMLTIDFLKPVCLAVLFAWPISWYGVRLFYSGFVSQAPFPSTWFILISICVVLIAALTISIKCLRVTATNPVQSLRYE